MASIDVSQLLEDSDFCSQVQINRQTEIVNEHGENVLSYANFTITASVQSVGANDAVTLPQGVQISDALTIYTKSPMISGRDSLLWNGKKFSIQRISSDNTHLGSGWMKCLAVKEDVT